MNENKHMLNFLMSMSFSLFGMLLIFGLGFVFPNINPYVVVKWIVIVCAVVFLYTILVYKVSWLLSWRASRKAKVAVKTVAKKTSKK